MEKISNNYKELLNYFPEIFLVEGAKGDSEGYDIR